MAVQLWPQSADPHPKSVVKSKCPCTALSRVMESLGDRKYSDMKKIIMEDANEKNAALPGGWDAIDDVAPDRFKMA